MVVIQPELGSLVQLVSGECHRLSNILHGLKDLDIRYAGHDEPGTIGDSFDFISHEIDLSLSDCQFLRQRAFWVFKVLKILARDLGCVNVDGARFLRNVNCSDLQHMCQ